MRKVIPFAILLLCMTVSKAQSLKNLTGPNEFSAGIEKVVQDFRKNYYNIQGEKLPSQEAMDVFRSTITLPGSLQNVIYRFHSKEDTTASWQSLLFQGENYEEAIKVYRQTCRMLNRTRVGFPSGTAGFSGKINDPDPNLAFTTSAFQLSSQEPAYQQFYAEIEILNTGIESWEVQLNLHSRKPDTERY